MIQTSRYSGHRHDEVCIILCLIDLHAVEYTYYLNFVKLHFVLFLFLIADKKKGDVAILKRGNRYIYYLIVKSRCFDKPTYQDLELSLQAMREHCRTYYVKELAIPKIGSGMNKMKWNRVSQIIKDTFKGTDISITIYSYDRPIHQHSVDPNADTL